MQKTIDHENIVVKNAREHNLKGVHLTIPRNKMTVFSGVSGSGKSSLAFDTIYAEGQRRYLESLSSYARQFLEQMKKPQVDSITGLSPAIAIDQKSVSTSPRSTVGTITEIYDYLRLLYARLGVPHCPDHDVPVQAQSQEQIVGDIKKLKPGAKIIIYAPVAQDKKGEFVKEIKAWIGDGYTRAKIDGKTVTLEQVEKLAKTKKHNIDLVVDRLLVEDRFDARLSQAVSQALKLGKGQVTVEELFGGSKTYSTKSACPECGFSFPPLEPRYFSFNSPRGACTTCNGLGTTDFEEVEYEVVTSEGRKITETRYKHVSASDDIDEELIKLKTCPDCHGQRLRPEILCVRLAEKNIAQLCELPAGELYSFLESQKWSENQKPIAEKIVQEIKLRLRFIVEVGVPYLSLNRSARSLSGGESQRLRLASQLGSSLVGILYVLDEPSIGLHPQDHSKLLRLLRQLCDRGNTLLVVEHDQDTIEAADHLVDIGPGAGVLGGQIISQGPVEEVLQDPKSITGNFITGKKTIPLPQKTRTATGYLKLQGATGNNLKNVDVDIPLGQLVAVTGVSGSGKSTLILETLYHALAKNLGQTWADPAPHQALIGAEQIERVSQIDQRPIGRTPRSIPGTYVGLFPLIRDLFSQLPESKIRGYAPGRFSFNVKGGRCEACMGQGYIKMVMHFLSDVFVLCDQCHGRRYNQETLNVKYRGKSIADVLEMNIDEAAGFFKNHISISRRLSTLQKVGLNYMAIGQSSTTLSGGEAQRVKLSKELSKWRSGPCFYILDEPTTGLHFSDIVKLIELLQSLVDQGHTVLVIEHNMDVVKCADHVIDMGPGGGTQGGRVCLTGTPRELAQNPQNATGKYLARYFL